jgi:hypothetical protein
MHAASHPTIDVSCLHEVINRSLSGFGRRFKILKEERGLCPANDAVTPLF